MEARLCNIGISEVPRLTIFSEDIIQVSNSFIEMSGYARNEILGKSIAYVFDLLKVNFYSNLFMNKRASFVFTKSQEVRNVVISIRYSAHKNIKVYEFNEILGKRQAKSVAR